MRILFILKKGEQYGERYAAQKSSGLYNSTNLISEALRMRGIHSRVVVVQDNNSIDKEVSSFTPDICVIEALWVVPDKFDVLKNLHPKVSWFCHLHSNIPFLSNEGMAFEWIPKYIEKGVGIIANSLLAYENLRVVLDCQDLFYLPNIYSRSFYPAQVHHDKEFVDVGCFGAIRPMKNHLMQALAAIKYGREIGKPVRFHINSGRIENAGSDSVLRNLRSLFLNEPDASLVEHQWFGPMEFLKYIHHHIDIGLQVSLSETFNVVTADYVTAGIPIVVSDEIPWVSRLCYAEENSVEIIVQAMHFVSKKKLLVRWNQHLLKEAANESIDRWISFCQEV